MKSGLEEMIAEAKRLVRKMIAQRSASDIPQVYAPSEIWLGITSMIRYVFSLTAEDFLQIRYHCDLFTGRDLIRYIHPWPPIEPATDVRARMYQLCAADLPERFRLGEPACPALPFVPGIPCENRIVNGSIVRFQLCANYLYRSGFASEILKSSGRPGIVEIGAGHGGLAHGLFHAFEEKVVCLLIDLPEMLLFQIPFLFINNPGKRFYIYDAETFTPSFVRDELPSYDFVFLPNFALHQLSEFPHIAVLLNVISFQEMSGGQVDDYLEFARYYTSLGIYSDNYDCHPNNVSDLGSVTDRLEKCFSLHSQPASFWDRVSPRGKIENFGQFRRFIGMNKTRADVVYPDFSASAIALEQSIRRLHGHQD